MSLRSYNAARAYGASKLANIALLLTQPVERGALPQLHAATAPAMRGGQFFGPSGFLEARGPGHRGPAQH